MDKKSLKVKIFLNFFGTYKKLSNVADITTTKILNHIENRHAKLPFLKKRE